MADKKNEIKVLKSDKTESIYYGKIIQIDINDKL